MPTSVTFSRRKAAQRRGAMLSARAGDQAGSAGGEQQSRHRAAGAGRFRAGRAAASSSPSPASRTSSMPTTTWRAYFSPPGRRAGAGDAARALAVRETPETKSLFVQCVRAHRTRRRTVARFRALLCGHVGALGAGERTGSRRREARSSGPAHRCVRSIARSKPGRDGCRRTTVRHSGLAAMAGDRIAALSAGKHDDSRSRLERFLTSARFAMLQQVSAADGASPGDGDRRWRWPARWRGSVSSTSRCLRAPTRRRRCAAVARERHRASWRRARRFPRCGLRGLGCYLPLHRCPARGDLEQDLGPPGFGRPDPTGAGARDGSGHCAPPSRRSHRSKRRLLLVRQQYEENPYPRWVRTDLPKTPLRFDQYMRTRFPDGPISAASARPSPTC